MIEIRPVSSAEHDALAVYLSSFPGETRGPGDWKNRFLLWWEKNQAFSVDVEKGWLLTEKQNIVGFIGSIPTFFQCQGETIIARNATTWRVLPAYRKHSLSLLFKLLEASQNSILFDTTPTLAVTEMLKTLGFRPLLREDDCYSILIVNPRNVIRSFLARAFLPPWLAGFLSPFSRILPMPNQNSFTRKDSLQVKRLEQADSSFDNLWERRRSEYANTGVRTARVVNWYCFADKDHEKLLFGCFKEGGLQAYMILAQDPDPKCRGLRCLDLWGDLETSGVLEAMLDSVWEYAWAESFDLVYFPHFSVPIGKKLRSLPLIGRRYRERHQYFKINQDRYQSIDEKNSYFTDLHGDIGL